ncbi:MAG: proteinral secretion pathway protein M [Gallionellaceae bacterium]|nr:MAG: proteinral secretion pathway protein M [Gallionellaceae bacterium]
MNSDVLMLMRSRWAALTASEQNMLKWGAVVVLPILFYLLLWQPAHTNVAKLQTSVPQMRAQLAQVQAQAVEVQTLRQGAHPAVLEGDALRHIVTGAAEAAGWSAPMFVIEQADKQAVRVTAESVEFARWVRFLRELDSAHHIRVDSLTVTPSPTTGMVKISATLTNGAPG